MKTEIRPALRSFTVTVAIIALLVFPGCSTSDSSSSSDTPSARITQLTPADFAGLWDFQIDAVNGGFNAYFIFYLNADGTVDVAADNYTLAGTFTIGAGNSFSMHLSSPTDEPDVPTQDYETVNTGELARPATPTAISGIFREVLAMGDSPFDHSTGFLAQRHDITFVTSIASITRTTAGTVTASEKLSRTVNKAGEFSDSGSFTLTASIPLPANLLNETITYKDFGLVSLGDFHAVFSPADDLKFASGSTKFSIPFDKSELLSLSMDVSSSDTLKVKLTSKYVHKTGMAPAGSTLLGRTLLGQASNKTTTGPIPVLIELGRLSVSLTATADVSVSTDPKGSGKSKLSDTLTAGGK